MSAVRYDLAIEQGADYTLSITWQDSSGNPIDLTGYSAAAEGRTAFGAVDTFFSITSSSGITLGGTAGTILIDIPATTTLLIPLGLCGVWDLKLTSAGGQIYRFAYGNVTNTAEVTI